MLVHPGGPFWAKKDDGAWSIPKGLVEDGEDPLTAARREFFEETGARISGDFIDLGSYKQPGGKTIAVWACEGDFDTASLKSNAFSIEWPPRSGKTAEFPEVDKAGWFKPARGDAKSDDRAKAHNCGYGGPARRMPFMTRRQRKDGARLTPDPRGRGKAGACPIFDLPLFKDPLMAFWLDIAAFVVKALIIVVIVAAIGGLALLVARLTRSREPDDQEIKVRSLNERYDDMRDALNAELLDKKARKALVKERKRQAKARLAGGSPKRIYVLAFKGDMRATAVKRLGLEIDAVLTVARPETDEVALRLESPGGTVTGYGLAAAEVLRFRERKIKVTALVDQVAASGGYMMACAADRIVAAPFAVVGSIGVVAPVPNLHRLLQKNEIDFEEMTAGEFKRSVSLLGEITPAAGSISAASSTRRTAPSRPSSSSAAPASPSMRSPTATTGSRARRFAWASSTSLRPATNTCFAPARARGCSKSRLRRERRCCSRSLAALDLPPAPPPISCSPQ